MGSPPPVTVKAASVALVYEALPGGAELVGRAGVRPLMVQVAVDVPVPAGDVALTHALPLAVVVVHEPLSVGLPPVRNGPVPVVL